MDVTLGLLATRVGANVGDLTMVSASEASFGTITAATSTVLHQSVLPGNASSALAPGESVVDAALRTTSVLSSPVYRRITSEPDDVLGEPDE